MTSSVRGRPLLVGIGAGVVCLAVAVGYIVGATGSETMSSFRIAGVLAFPISGPAMAAYAGVLALLVLGGLFAAVEAAARREDRRRSRREA